MSLPHRLRLKLPSGAEIEAEGTPEFVSSERSEFLRRIEAPLAAAAGGELAGQAAAGFIPNISWETITESKGKGLLLRTKLPPGRSEADACLVLLGAAQKILHQPKPTAAQLAKWLRGSGYPIVRVDRALQQAIEKGEVLSSGSRRARRYELTAPGRLRAHILANQLTVLITGRP